MLDYAKLSRSYMQHLINNERLKNVLEHWNPNMSSDTLDRVLVLRLGLRNVLITVGTGLKTLCKHEDSALEGQGGRLLVRYGREDTTQA